MGFYNLFLKFNAENVYSINISPEFQWVFTLKCTNCLSQHKNDIYLSVIDEIDLKSIKANFVMKCKDCGYQITIYIDSKSKNEIRVPEDSGVGSGVLAVFECRGCEIVKWSDRSGFIVKSLSGYIFKEVDLNDIWMDFDENTKENCIIENLTYNIMR